MYTVVMSNKQRAYISTKDAAKLLGVSGQRVRDLIKAGRLEAFKIGRDWAVSLDSVQEFERGKPWQFTDKDAD